MTRKIIHITFFFFILFGCKKEEKPQEVKPLQELTCEPFPFTPVSWYTIKGMQFKSPCFNPNNSDEFVYNEFNLDAQTFQLVKYNIVSKLRTVLSEQVRTLNIPKWSNAGWIAFDNQFDYQMWVVKENGDSLHKVSEVDVNMYPAWRNDGKTLYWLYAPELSVPYTMHKHKIGSLHTDAIVAEYTSNYDISLTNKFATEYYIGNTGYIAFADIDDITAGLHDFTPTGEINLLNVCWSHDDKHIYFLLHQKGLYQMDIATGISKMLKKFCGNSYYKTVTSSTDGKYLIGEKVDATMSYAQGVPTGQIIQKSNVYVIHIPTMKEIKIEL